MHRSSIVAMPVDDNERVRKAFAKFLKTHKKEGVSGRAVSEAGGLSSSAASQILQGNSRSPKIETLRSLAKGAGDILNRPVSLTEMFEMEGAKPDVVHFGGHGETVETPIQHYVGAGDEVHLIDDAGTETPIDWTASPPGFERDRGAAVIVRGDSMRPVYDPGDLLFFRHRRDPPATKKDIPERPVIVEIKGGRLFVKKIIPGSKDGRFHLISVNPLTPIIQDQPVRSFAYIEWVKPLAR